MKFEIELSEKEARLVCVFIRRAIFEQFERNISECGFSKEENRNRTYDTIGAFEEIKDQLTNKLMERK